MRKCRRLIRKVFGNVIGLFTTSAMWVGFPDFPDSLSASEKPKLFQIHHQDKIDFSSEMIAQSEVSLGKEILKWQKGVAERHPLPNGKQWLVCNEKSRYFVMSTDPPVYHPIEATGE